MQNRADIKIPKRISGADLNGIVHAEIADLASKLRRTGLSTSNCMIVVRANGEFYVASTGISAMDHQCAAEDFGRMILSSFDDNETAIKFLCHLLREIRITTMPAPEMQAGSVRQGK